MVEPLPPPETERMVGAKRCPAPPAESVAVTSVKLAAVTPLAKRVPASVTVMVALFRFASVRVAGLAVRVAAVSTVRVNVSVARSPVPVFKSASWAAAVMVKAPSRVGVPQMVRAVAQAPLPVASKTRPGGRPLTP